MYKINNSGPKFDPWGTPQRILCCCDLFCPILHVCILSVKYDLNHELKTKESFKQHLINSHGRSWRSLWRSTCFDARKTRRLPLFSMTFPSWFLEKYPEISKNIKTNTNRLTSWYDVYATFRHMISYPQVPTNLKHGQSLFTEIPSSRTCAQANVEEHWCPCLEWASIAPENSHACQEFSTCGSRIHEQCQPST